MIRLLRLGIGVVALAVLVVLHIADGHRRDREMARLQSQILALAVSEAPMAPVVNTAQAYLPAREVSPVAQAAAVASAVANVPTDPVVVRPSVAERRDNLDAAFIGEGPSTNWSARDERDARGKIGNLLPPGAEIRSFDCRESMCRIEIGYPDTRSFHAYMDAEVHSSEQIPWNAPRFTSLLETLKGDDSRVTAVTFAARPGRQLPN
jgi:hypothetical protein